MRIYIVQGDPRDHHGEIILVTHDRDKAEKRCVKFFLEENGRTKRYRTQMEQDLHDSATTMSQDAFLQKYLGCAWLVCPQLSSYEVRCPGGE